MPERILFKYASKSRVELFFRGLDSIVDNLHNHEDYSILCSFDVNDAAYRNHEFIERLSQYQNLEYYFGISESKICAINRDCALAPPFSILVNFSDDQVFTQPGFDELIRDEMKQAFPDMDGVLNFKDTNNNGSVMTMTICGVKYFNRFNYIYYNEYKSEYADIEAQEVAKRLGKLKNIPIVISKHLHPKYKTAPTDNLYEHSNTLVAQDRELYFKRLNNNFYLQA